MRKKVMIIKPETLEENLYNIDELLGSFDSRMGSFWQKFMDIKEECDTNSLSTSIKLSKFLGLSDEINGYIVQMFEKISYALDYIRKTKNHYSRAVTSKEYDAAIIFLQENKWISPDERAISIQLREKRNEVVHEFLFCKYFFDNAETIHRLLYIVKEILEGMNPNKFLYFLNEDENLEKIKSMEKALTDYAIRNGLKKDIEIAE